MNFFILETTIGIIIIVAVVVFLLRGFRNSTLDDQRIINIVKKELQNDTIGRYEISSIITLEDMNITTVIIQTDYYAMSLEIDNSSGHIFS